MKKFDQYRKEVRRRDMKEQITEYIENKLNYFNNYIKYKDTY